MRIVIWMEKSGVYLDAGSVVEDNRIYQNEVGIYGFYSSGAVEDNTIFSNGCGAED